jgi:molybdopterin molybdotransferase
VEDTDAEAGAAGVVEVRQPSPRGMSVRPRGQDVSAGEVVLGAATTLTPGALALAAAAGHARLPVIRAPRVAVLSSGDELRSADDFDDVMAGLAVPESNGPALVASVRASGAAALGMGIARDDERDIREKVGAALGADVLITSGGASVGEADLLKRVLETMGLQIDFWRVRIRPGSPFSLGRLPREGGGYLPVLGLPGNPASAFVTFQLFVRPLILTLAGHRWVHRRVITATAAETLESTPRLTHFHRIVLSGPPEAREVRLAGHQASGLVRSLAVAHGLAVVPEGRAAVHAGDPVEVILLDDAPGASDSAGYRAAVTR